MIRAALGGLAVAAALGGGWWVYGVWAEKERLQVEVASQAREIAVQKAVLEQAQTARAIAQAEADRQKRAATEYENLRNSLVKGDNDAPLPDWFIAYLADLLQPRGAR